jgi:hypothetical protein
LAQHSVSAAVSSPYLIRQLFGIKEKNLVPEHMEEASVEGTKG